MGQRERKRGIQADSALNIEPDVKLDSTTLKSQPELKPGIVRPTDCTHMDALKFIFKCDIYTSESDLFGRNIHFFSPV